MPIITRFFGIIIYMFWNDHSPPHFHAKYQDEEIIMEIESGNITGKMSKTAILLIEQWRKLHVNELLNDWKLAEQRKEINKIEPLE